MVASARDIDLAFAACRCGDCSRVGAGSRAPPTRARQRVGSAETLEPGGDCRRRGCIGCNARFRPEPVNGSARSVLFAPRHRSAFGASPHRDTRRCKRATPRKKSEPRMRDGALRGYDMAQLPQSNQPKSEFPTFGCTRAPISAPCHCINAA
jgi:hypothetical protein